MIPDLPSEVEEAKSYTLTGRTINRLLSTLRRMAVTAGPGLQEKETPKGTILYLASTAPQAAACPLGSIGSDGKITPGWFLGGGKNEIIEPGAITPAVNKKVWIKVPWTADKVDGVLQAGGDAGTISIHSGTGSVPDDDVPNISSLTGNAYYALGYWDSDLEFIGNSCGTITIDFCPGGFTKGRQP